MTEQPVEPEVAPEDVDTQPIPLVEVANNVAPLTYTPSPCSTCG